jgi:hypothetical protein
MKSGGELKLTNLAALELRKFSADVQTKPATCIRVSSGICFV